MVEQALEFLSPHSAPVRPDSASDFRGGNPNSALGSKPSPELEDAGRCENYTRRGIPAGQNTGSGGQRARGWAP